MSCSTYYVLFFIHLESRRVDIAGINIHPDEPWMKQIVSALFPTRYSRRIISKRSVLGLENSPNVVLLP